MSEPRCDGHEDLPDADLQRRALAEQALELALAPAPRRDRLEALLGGFPTLASATAPARSLSGQRLALVDLARALLDAPDPAVLLGDSAAQGVARAWMLRLFEHLGGPSALEDDAMAILWQRGTARSEDLGGAEALARDARDFADAEDEALLDAHRLVRVYAVAQRAARQASAGRDAARDLLGVPVRAFADLSAELPLMPSSEPRSAEPLEAGMLRARVDLVAALHWALGSLSDGAELDERVALLQQVAARLLGVPVALALAETETELTLSGALDLDGTTLALLAERSAAAAALASQAPCSLHDLTGASVIDRQIARRLDSVDLLAVPMFASEAVGVLLVPGRVDRFGALALAALAAPLLWQPLRTQRRLESAGRTVRSRYEARLREVIHEANNPLSVIHNYLHILGSRLDDESTGKEQLRLIGDEIQRTSEILQALVQAPSVTGAPVPEVRDPVSLNGLVREVIDLLEPALMDAAGIRVETDLDAPDARLARGGAGLRQILLNLLKNAVEAMPDGGSIRIATRAAVATAAGPGIEITVTDSGPGIAPHLLPELFASGVTTRGPGRGLGLGIVQRLIGELGGFISARSAEGGGTSFRIFLPQR